MKLPFMQGKPPTGPLASTEDETITPLSVKAEYHGLALNEDGHTIQSGTQEIDTSYYDGAENALTSWIDSAHCKR